MSARTGWTREQLLVAFYLYCQLPFGQLHSRNPEIIRHAGLIGRTPSALAMKLSNIASLDPAITSSGRKGLQGASATDKAMWEEAQADWERFATEAQQAMSMFGAVTNPTPTLDETEDYTGSNKTVTTTTRVGQDFFRRAVLSAYNNRCCITGLSIPKLLVASHIVPWRVDTKNRLNPRNGLCLSMLHDKAFDAGIIGISADMTIRVSRKHAVTKDPFFNSALLAYDRKPIVLPEKFYPLEEFLTYHREHIFET